MKSPLRAMLLVLLAGVCAGASAQRHTLFSPLPSGTDRQQALEVARQVLTARGWQPALTDRESLEARKGLSGIRLSVRENPKSTACAPTSPRHSRASSPRCPAPNPERPARCCSTGFPPASAPRA